MMNFFSLVKLVNNRAFALHIETGQALLSRVHEISSMTMDEIKEQMDQGNNLLDPIHLNNV